MNILVGQDIFGPSIPYLQWAYSAVTSNLNGIYLPNSTESFGSIFPSYYKGRNPEFSNIPSTWTYDNNISNLFTYNVGGFLSRFEVYYFILLTLDANNGNVSSSNALVQQFGINITLANEFYSYFEDLFTGYYMGGKTIVLSAYEILWGYQDVYLTNLVNTIFDSTY